MEQEQIGKLLRIGGAAATVGVVSCVHIAAELMPLGQLMAMRAIISGVLILTYGLIFKPAVDLYPKRWQPHLVRGGLACIAMLFSYIAFARLPVSQAQTLLFLAPLIVVPFASYQLGERPTKRALLGLVLGFSGVLLILGVSFDTGPDAIWGVLCGIIAAVFVAIIQVRIRSMMATETAISTALSFTLIVAVASLFSFVLGDWVWPRGDALWVLLAAGVFGALNLVLFAESLARAPVSTIAPLDYTGLIWALLVDWIVFSVLPGTTSLLGSVLVTLGALIIVLAPLRRTTPAPLSETGA